MSEDKKARLDVIDDIVGSDETVVFDVLALLFDPGGGLKKREAEGSLVLTSQRLIFGTVRHGILVDVALKEIDPPATIGYKWMMARLAIVTDQGTKHTFVVNKVAARDIASAVNRAATA